MHSRRLATFVDELIRRTAYLRMVGLLAGLWFVFSTAMYLSERGIDSHHEP